MQTPPIEVRHPETGKIIGMRCNVRGIVRYIPIESIVVSALRVFREALGIEERTCTEPEWDDLSKEDEELLSQLEGIEHIAFLARQTH